MFKIVLMRLIAVLIFALSNIVIADNTRVIETLIEDRSSAATGQNVSVRYDYFNIDSGWALAYGELFSVSSDINWKLVAHCVEILDKGLWAVLKSQVKVESLSSTMPVQPSLHIGTFTLRKITGLVVYLRD